MNNRTQLGIHGPSETNKAPQLTSLFLLLYVIPPYYRRYFASLLRLVYLLLDKHLSRQGRPSSGVAIPSRHSLSVVLSVRTEAPFNPASRPKWDIDIEGGRAHSGSSNLQIGMQARTRSDHLAVCGSRARIA